MNNKTMERNSLGTIFREARGKRPLIDVVDKIKSNGGKITESYLSRIEADKQIPSQEIGGRIANALNIPTDQIVKMIVIKKISELVCRSGYSINPKIVEGKNALLIPS